MKTAILKIKIVSFFLMSTIQLNAQMTAFFDGFESQATSPWTSYLGFYDWYYESQFTAGTCPAGQGNFYAVYDPLPPSKIQIDLPITWEDTTNIDHTVTDFGGCVSSVIGIGNSKVLKTDKPSGAQTWAGTTLSTPSGLASAIPFTQGSTKIACVIYAPAVGQTVRLKVEDAANSTIYVEVDVTTSVANAWDTLEFDFNAQVPGTPAINFSNTYDKISIFYNFGVSPTTTATYYVDDVFFIGAAPTSPILPSSDDIYTTVSLPGDISESRIEFKWAIETFEPNISPTEYDSINVKIRSTTGTLISSIAKFTNLDAYAGAGCFSWNNANFSLPSSLINPGFGSSGSTFRISFECYNDAQYATSFYLDSVAVIYQPCNIPITPVSATICDNQSYTTAGGQVVNTAGVYYDTLQAVTGCDSVIETTLNVNPTFLTPVSATICDNQSYTTAGGQVVNTAGVYYDTLQAVTGCDSVIETTLNVNPLPVSISLGTDTIICNNIPEITLDGGDFVRHSWFKDNNLLTDTTRFLTVTGQLGAGSYHVLYEDLNGCSTSSDTLEITYNEICPSVEKLFSTKGLINFYPNPTIGILTFNSDKEISKIKLTDISGKVVYDYQINAETNSLDISHFNNGIYFIIVLFSDGQMQTNKIILLK